MRRTTLLNYHVTALMVNLKYIVTAIFLISFQGVLAQNIEGSFSEIPLTISGKNLHDISLNQQKPGEYQIETTGSDPYLFTAKLKQQIPEDHFMLSFEYFCPTWLDHLQIFFSPPVDEDRSIHTELGVAEGWKTFSIDVKDYLSVWGKKGDFLRLDFGSAPNYKMQIRNIRFRKPTVREMQVAANRNKNKVRDLALTQHLNNYLNTKYPCSITHVSVDTDQIEIRGNSVAAKEKTWLAEIPLYEDITELDSFDNLYQLPANGENFNLKTDRFVIRDNQQYDRLLSKWAVVQKKGDHFILLSHARYPDDIKPLYHLPDEKPWNKKGLGGFHVGGKAPVTDLDSLNISSVTVNIWVTKFIHSKPSENTMPFKYNGKTFYADAKAVEDLDKTLQLTAKKKIIVSAIILINKASDLKDKEIGKIFEHPDCDPAGIYSMANVTSFQGLQYYAAIMDFLAQRYSRPDEKYGRIHHWIIHNEVDAGWVWTNMGEKPPLLFMDDYVKSMRTVYNIARKYNEHTKVFISLTHYWTWTADRHYYHPKELLEILLRYCKAEGDFEWAIAQHPYPESLFEPKSWLDQRVDFTFNTPLITYKNIEVLNAWVNQPETFYLGKTKRTIWLSEQGTNSMDYTEKSLKEQAAGMAYAWKKIKNLENIEGFQYHNWMDNRGEGGLRIGLRRFPDDEQSPGGKKPIWYVFRDMGTNREDTAFKFAKKIIGIDNWSEVNFEGEIDSANREKSYRNLKSDTWQATDALGRKLPDFNEVGPLKKDRHVGIFYFLTHNNAGKPGPSDVSKIVAKNPENPQWGSGTHYWGEPAFGYYLSTDKWVIRKHAQMLADAGVDVIIFDCTNNVTYPEVTKTIFEVFRQMRSEGERTPAIAFLASEKSVYQIWDQIYAKGLYADLWFRWKGKPLLLFGQWAGIKPMNEVVFPSKIKNFFSIRNSWAWTTLPWYKNDGKDMWPWIDHYPQHIGWHTSKAQAEYVPVAVAEHPLSNIGRSYHNGKQPETDKYDLTPLTGKGLFFEEQWKRALAVDPEFVFVTGWNEWTAGKQIMKKDVEKELKVWDFYPGAKLGKVGKTLKEGDTYFIDQYNQEYSRDIEPMNGGHNDNYYYQLMANIRKYKGVQRPEKAIAKTIKIEGDFKQWDDSLATYLDHTGDIAPRNAEGNFQAGPYINASGRNDIAKVEVTNDEQNIYFYVVTQNKLSSFKNENWMQIFVDADRNKSTGWQGYDFIINGRVKNTSTTTIATLNKQGKMIHFKKVAMQIKNNQLMLSVPRSILQPKHLVDFEFHIADNATATNKLSTFFSDGDHAPSRRENYLYSTR